MLGDQGERVEGLSKRYRCGCSPLRRAALDAVDVLLPTHHWSAWTALFGAPIGGTQLATGIASAVTWLIGTAIVAVWRMRTRDVLS